MPVPEWLSRNDLPSLMVPARTGVPVADETPQWVEWLQVGAPALVRPTFDHLRPTQPSSSAYP